MGNKDMAEEKIWSLIGFLEVSPARKKTFKAIGDADYILPSNISRKTDLTSSQVSNALKDLKNKKLVVCLNEEVSKGRLYKCTDLGLEVLTKLK